MLDWNVVVTLHRSFHHGIGLLRRFGKVERTGLYNVLVMRVPDVHQLLAQIAALPEADGFFTTVSRVSPVTQRFRFATAEELERQARERLIALAPELGGKRLHIRVRRRGHKGELHAHALEGELAAALLEELARRATPGRIAFDDPDVVIAIELLRDEAGLAVWTRAELERYPFLRASIERGLPRRLGAAAEPPHVPTAVPGGP